LEEIYFDHIPENNTVEALRERIFTVNESNFEAVALQVFRLQYEKVEIYRLYCDGLGRTPATVNSLAAIPFLPIGFFKTHTVIAAGEKPAAIFESSGTTGEITSKHPVADLGLYETSFLKTFELFYGKPEDHVVLALLPSYLERGNSSLVYMAKHLIEKSTQNASGFFLNDFEKLYEWLDVLKRGKRKVLLLGVTFALLDFAERYKLDFPNLVVMETGGMKGRREELTRAEVHQRLRIAFDVKHIHSEYGMTELLSQGYSKGEGVFHSPQWMKILTRDIYDPLMLQEGDATGAVNVIDLANLYSCSFIATGDLGRLNADGSFEILGRMDSAEVRGCNLMVV
jgi:phenylacetate-coenzyme A ligase PaaK-like adenylate-forming protein